ncbi:4Fe-4S dicluster domain-containing protein [Acetohalobium arabaticum]|uniref:Dihydroorotate dehydrogenase B (NAD(+)), catalytic subunit n=1 Tax=Acetohalobium arabaticum (strain ATCC 49924 / DSM 5501 / Z-7288) TaxID=574087 RepID=D9QUU7_ACEAZ|nr:4Fe-4S dicluster domain-containing protein [Acetohalobium arabaticum]ADL12006.1 dihydroorotate dehydrogenase family protein [Acetohalobium arabaticum DSM 5501]
MKPDLSTEVCGVEFKNPIVVASATPTHDAEAMRKCVEAGAGGLVAKTFSPEPLTKEYVSPRFTVLHKEGWPDVYSNYSCEFLATFATDEWMKQMEEAAEYCHEHDVRLIGSISGTTMESWQDLAQRIEATGIDMLELNFGCPHPRDLDYKSGQVLGSSPEAAAEVTEAVVEVVDIPVFIKVTPEAVSPVEVTKRVTEAGAAGVTAINRYPALDIDIEDGRPLLHSTYAGVGGPWMRPITLKWLSKISKEVGAPISATNGISTWKDIVKCIMVGASTVQTCTALMYGQNQYGKIEDFIEGLEDYMEDKGYDSLDELRGITLPQIKTWDEVDRESKATPEVIPEECIGCGMCLNWCFYDAISLYEEDGETKAKVDPDKCDHCGLCVSLCPKEALNMEYEDKDEKVYLGDFE